MAAEANPILLRQHAAVILGAAAGIPLILAILVMAASPFQGPPLQPFWIVCRIEVPQQVVLEHNLDHFVR
jgi:hypothetical protein